MREWSEAIKRPEHQLAQAAYVYVERRRDSGHYDEDIAADEDGLRRAFLALRRRVPGVRLDAFRAAVARELE